MRLQSDQNAVSITLHQRRGIVGRGSSSYPDQLRSLHILPYDDALISLINSEPIIIFIFC